MVYSLKSYLSAIFIINFVISAPKHTNVVTFNQIRVDIFFVPICFLCFKFFNFLTKPYFTMNIDVVQGGMNYVVEKCQLRILKAPIERVVSTQKPLVNKPQWHINGILLYSTTLFYFRCIYQQYSWSARLLFFW